MRHRHTATQVTVHWLFVIEALVLTATGFYLHRPVGGARYGLATFVHLVCGYVLLSTVAFRVWWLIAGEPVDWRASLRAVRASSWMGRSRYLVYVVLWLALGGLVVTGLALRFPTEDILANVAHYLGGMVGVRTVHYLLMWVFVSALVVHTYQPLLHGGRYFAAMFVPASGGDPSAGSDEDAASCAGGGAVG